MSYKFASTDEDILKIVECWIAYGKHDTGLLQVCLILKICYSKHKLYHGILILFPVLINLHPTNIFTERCLPTGVRSDPMQKNVNFKVFCNISRTNFIPFAFHWIRHQIYIIHIKSSYQNPPDLGFQRHYFKFRELQGYMQHFSHKFRSFHF